MAENRILVRAGNGNNDIAAVTNPVVGGARPHNCKTLRDYFKPDINQIGSSIVRPTVQANNFKLRQFIGTNVLECTSIL